MKIVFFCPPVSVINGGIKHIFRMAEYLRVLGYDAVVFEQNGQHPAWFASAVPVVGQGIFDPDASQVYVLPEDQPHILADFKAFPQRKIIYSQNHFYSALGIADANSFADYDITHIICSSQTIYEHTRLRHPTIAAHVVPCSVDQSIFKTATVKRDIIAYMPRKRAIEAAYIRDMFCFSYPDLRSWEWRELNGLSEQAVAAALAESKVFLSLSRLEGLGLTPLEAMAAGCTVAGFTGIGGREYATENNGFWADEDDFPAAVNQLGRAVQVWNDPVQLANLHVQSQTTLESYSPESFYTAIKAVWSQILSEK